jgi:cytochrome c-type biogenesis protein CcmH/NrfF
MAIAEELRCLVCQNETIAASHADLAVDLRKQIAAQAAAGQSQTGRSSISWSRVMATSCCTGRP